ncbi:MAG: DUF1624 domain-containing protein [Flavobacteriia bacterium]|nr:DUF1624 domain-containing protein [Flavobacteriia bacterium]
MKPKSRLIFIDIARSIAILLMLEGHFVDDSLMEVYRDKSNSIFYTWEFIRGFTSPIFLTVTGIVFVYLLMGNNHLQYFKNIRVTKGFKRSIELLFWGYLLQVYAFHVLQCIGVGIFTILILYGLYKLIKVIPLWIYFFLMGTFIFSTYIYFGTIPEEQYWPTNAPVFIQNMFHGKHSVFPILPRMGYTMYGAMFGVILYTFKDKVKTWGFSLITITIGIFLFFFLKEILIYIDYKMGNLTYHIYKLDWLYECLGMVMIVLGSLIIFEILVGEIKPNLFLKMGQNTLTVYILHMVVLYGSLTGLGLNKLFHHSLTPWQLIPITLSFISIFLILVYNLDKIKAHLSFLLVPIKSTSNKLFGIKE